jgi:hypothetical protein
MRLTRIRILVATSLVATAGTVTGTALAAAAAPARSDPVFLVQCNGKGQVKPSSSLQPSCMESSEYIPKLTWTSWTSSAFGSGTFAVNNCTPSASCGLSKYTKYPILIVLWKAAAWPKHPGKQYFTRMTLIFTGSGKQFPKGHPAVDTYTLLASQP